MRFEPYEYQKTAIRWIMEKPCCGLFLDMGLGKTVITLTAIRQMLDDCEIERVLVVAPKKVAQTTWSTEAGKWSHLEALRVVRVLGSPKKRREALTQPGDVYVIGRDNFVWLVNEYGGRLPFDMVVLDELTSFKSPKSQRFKAMKIARQDVRRVVGLTGTPAPNGLEDLWAQIYCLDGGRRLGPNITQYRKKYFNIYTWNHIIVRCEVRPGCDDEIRKKISDICLSMKAEDYIQLPPIMIHTEKIELSPAIMKKYKEFERDKVLQFEKDNEEQPKNIIANNAAALMNKLTQYANGAVYDEDGTPHTIHNEKLERLSEIIEAANGEPVLVFYQYRHDVPRIKKRLKAYKVKTFDNPEQLTQWNRGEIDVLLAHPASTAYGLNMQQGGHYIVWYGLGWNLEHYQQANARLHRQGQRQPVTVYNLVCTGTADEQAEQALRSKDKTQQKLLTALDFLIRKHKVQTSKQFYKSQTTKETNKTRRKK